MDRTRMDVTPGEVWWAEMSPGVGREQVGRRPVLVVSTPTHLELATTLAIVVPITSRDRAWPNHVAVRLDDDRLDGFAMTEQVRTVSRERLVRRVGRVADGCLGTVREWVVDFVDDPDPVGGESWT